MSEAKGTVFIVDDDEAVRDGLLLLLRSHGYHSQAFSSGDALLNRCTQPLPQRLMAILDLSMPGMDGLTLQEELLRRRIAMPVVFLSGGGDIPAAVDAVRHGAVDFVEKPVDSDVLIDRVERALETSQKRDDTAATEQIFQEQVASLTPRERQVLDSIADGKTAKRTALNLGISERTVELHRSRVLKKMGVRNATELLNRVIPNLRPRKDQEG
ncbi:MAG: response regulator [Arenicellales bacterium]